MSNSTSLKRRCFRCSKKTLYNTSCKCGNEFCLNCISSFNHNCTYNWKNDRQRELTIANPRIIAQKVENI